MKKQIISIISDELKQIEIEEAYLKERIKVITSRRNSLKISLEELGSSKLLKKANKNSLTPTQILDLRASMTK